MAPFDGEYRWLDIHAILGGLRKRIYEISSGTATAKFDEGNMKNVNIYIHDYSPDDIIKNICPLKQQLEAITERTLNSYSKDTDDFGDESQFDSILHEVEYYKNELSAIIERYKGDVPNSEKKDNNIKLPLSRYKYQYFKEAGSDKALLRFRDTLSEFIDPISNQAFLNIFSGEQDEVTRKINWKNKTKNLCAYFIVEISRIMGFPKGDHIWLVASKYITYNNQIITTRFRTNYKPNKIQTLKDKNGIDNALKIFSSSPSSQ